MVAFNNNQKLFIKDGCSHSDRTHWLVEHKTAPSILDINILMFRGQKWAKGQVVGYRVTLVSLVLECERIDCMDAFQTYQPIYYSYINKTLRRFSICTLLTTQKVAICWIATLKILLTPQIWLGDWGRWVWLIKAMSNGNLAAASTQLLPKAVWLAMWLIILTDLSGLWCIFDKWNLIIFIYFIATINTNKCLCFGCVQFIALC